MPARFNKKKWHMYNNSNFKFFVCLHGKYMQYYKLSFVETQLK